MLRRCLDPKHHKYRLYGAMGVTICESWLDFERFVADVGGTAFPRSYLGSLARSVWTLRPMEYQMGHAKAASEQPPDLPARRRLILRMRSFCPNTDHDRLLPKCGACAPWAKSRPWARFCRGYSAPNANKYPAKAA